MLIDSQIRNLQNFADKFNLTVSYFQYEDLRKKTKFILTKNGTCVSQPLNYNETNIFLLGILNAKKYNL